MSALKNIIGQRFGKLVVLERVENAKDGKARWKCRCDCGRETVVRSERLRNGQKSCGCIGRCGKPKNLIGQRFGRLKVIRRVENDRRGNSRWGCRCDCGNEVVVAGGKLKSGNTQSCGCLSKEVSTKHGMRHSKIYNTWCGIKARCFNPNESAYKNYGGRGITMYEPWINDFQAFYDYVSTLEHFGESGYTLDREDNNGNYEPGNLRWATKKEQARNTRTNVVVEYNGEKMTLTEAAEHSGINLGTLWNRYRAGDYERGRLFRPLRGK